MVTSNSAASSSPSSSAIAGTKTVAPALTHPYMQECYPRSSRTLNNIWKNENSVLNKIIGRSNWQSYPQGPSQCYERQERSSNNEMRTASTTTTTTIGSGSSITFPVNEEEDRRITALNMGDNTFFERFRLHQMHIVPMPVGIPRVPSFHLRPYWIMTKDIAILDQLESIELFRCSGTLPKSMNHLTKLTRLHLDGCHRNIDLSQLGLSRSLQNLMELKITDCEGLTPTKFRNLPHLQYLTLKREVKSNINTIDLGKNWIAELSSSAVNCSTAYDVPEDTADPRVNQLSSVSAGARKARRTVGAVQLPWVPLSLSCTSLGFRCTLKQLTFCGARLTNHDLGRMLFHMVPKFPNLETLIINDNKEIDSFKKVIDAMEVLASVAAPPHSLASERTAMRTTIMTTTVAATATTASSLDTTTMVTAGTALNSYVVDIGGVPLTIAQGIPTASGPLCVAGVNVTTINGVPIRIINKEDTNTSTTDAATRNQISIKLKLRTLKVSDCMILSDSMINPTSLEELYSVIYFLEHLYPTIGVLKVFSYDDVTDENPDDGCIELQEKQADKLHKIEYLLAMNSTNAFTMTNSSPSSSLASSMIPVSLLPLAIAKAYRKKYGTCYQESYLHDETNFRQDNRFDVMYHLLRNGPYLYAAGQTCRYKRKRVHYARGAKYRGAEKSNKN